MLQMSLSLNNILSKVSETIDVEKSRLENDRIEYLEKIKESYVEYFGKDPITLEEIGLYGETNYKDIKDYRDRDMLMIFNRTLSSMRGNGINVLYFCDRIESLNEENVDNWFGGSGPVYYFICFKNGWYFKIGYNVNNDCDDGILSIQKFYDSVEGIVIDSYCDLFMQNTSEFKTNTHLNMLNMRYSEYRSTWNYLNDLSQKIHEDYDNFYVFVYDDHEYTVLPKNYKIKMQNKQNEDMMIYISFKEYDFAVVLKDTYENYKGDNRMVSFGYTNYDDFKEQLDKYIKQLEEKYKYHILHSWCNYINKYCVPSTYDVKDNFEKNPLNVDHMCMTIEYYKDHHRSLIKKGDKSNRKFIEIVFTIIDDDNCKLTITDVTKFTEHMVLESEKKGFKNDKVVTNAELIYEKEGVHRELFDEMCNFVQKLLELKGLTIDFNNFVYGGPIVNRPNFGAKYDKTEYTLID